MTLNMPVDRRKTAIIAAAVVLRIIVFAFFPQLPDLLTGQVEVSTPISSFKRCTKQIFLTCDLADALTVQEGLFLYTRNASPYEGGIFHQVWNSPALPTSFH